MDELLEMIKWILPAVLMGGMTFLLLKKYLDNEERKRKYEIRKNLNEHTLPIRLQAYERIILFLERISPQSLLMRIPAQRKTVRDYQTVLLQTIRSEFEHNLTQQIYVSNNGWEISKRAKEEIIKIINVTANNLKQNDPAIELSKAIFSMISKNDKLPTQVAIEYLKKEVKQLF